MVHGYKVFWHIRSNLGWSNSVLAILPYNPLLRPARLYGQFFLDKTWMLLSYLKVSANIQWVTPSEVILHQLPVLCLKNF